MSIQERISSRCDVAYVCDHAAGGQHRERASTAFERVDRAEREGPKWYSVVSAAATEKNTRGASLYSKILPQLS